jgi:hypothetical protein
MLNIQSTLRTFSDLCKNVSLVVLFGNKEINTQSVRSQICVYIYIYIYSSQYRDAGRAKEIKFGTAVNAACQRCLIFPRAIGSSALI